MKVSSQRNMRLLQDRYSKQMHDFVCGKIDKFRIVGLKFRQVLQEIVYFSQLY